jgi:glycosyltransferase involved in cell wall biosynthesis
MPDDEVGRLFQADAHVKISVVLPTLNESVMLRRTVEQFRSTLPEPSEIIVVDNGSTDGSADFLDESEFEDVVLIREPKPLGVAGARNRGFAEARGEVVVFADAHVDIPERWWQPMVAVLKNPEVGVVGPAIGVMGDPDHPAACGQRIASRSLAVRWFRRDQIEPYQVPTLGGGFMAMRRSTLLEAGAFDDGMPQWGSEDLEICLRYWLLGLEVWVAPEVIIRHYFRDTAFYEVDTIFVTHNLLRVAVLHFDGDRLASTIHALQYRPDFAKAMALTIASDAALRRAEFAERRVRDIAWLFEKFPDCCPS